jgi:hypothetical protein
MSEIELLANAIVKSSFRYWDIVCTTVRGVLGKPGAASGALGLATRTGTFLMACRKDWGRKHLAAMPLYCVLKGLYTGFSILVGSALKSLLSL